MPPNGVVPDLHQSAVCRADDTRATDLPTLASQLLHQRGDLTTGYALHLRHQWPHRVDGLVPRQLHDLVIRLGGPGSLRIEQWDLATPHELRRVQRPGQCDCDGSAGLGPEANGRLASHGQPSLSPREALDDACGTVDILGDTAIPGSGSEGSSS